VRAPLLYGIFAAAMFGHVNTDARVASALADNDPVASSSAEAPAAPKPVGVTALALRAQQIQVSVDGLLARLAIQATVVVSVVPKNDLLVSVAPRDGGRQVFELALQNDFLSTLTEDELVAAVAHELGHVWIFTHHPYLQTEELANDVALRVVERDSLERMYKKVWQQTGAKGDLVYLPAR